MNEYIVRYGYKKEKALVCVLGMWLESYLCVYLCIF